MTKNKTMKAKNYLALTLILLVFSASAQDGYLADLALNKYLKTSFNYPLSLKVRNTSNTPIFSMTVKWQLDGGVINSESFNVGGGGLVSSNYLPLTLSPDLNLPSGGSHELKVWVEVAGDTDNSNDTITKEIIGLSSYADNNVLIEKYTATWCEWCPAASTVFNTLKSNPRVVMASFHNSDTYSFTNGEDYMEAYYPAGTFTPGGIINMGEMGSYEINSQHTTWEDQLLARIGISPVDLQLTTTIDTITRELTIDVTANFKYAFTSDFYLNAYILEHNIAGSQTNGGGNPYYHQNVVRQMVGGTAGIAGVIPALPVINTDYSYQDTITIPSAWDIMQIEVIAYVFDKENLSTNSLNAASKVLFVGIHDVPEDFNSLRLYPNPVSNYLVLQSDEKRVKNYQLKIYDITGKLVLTNTLADIQNQRVNVETLASGVFFLHLIDSAGDVHQFKMIKQ